MAKKGRVTWTVRVRVTHRADRGVYVARAELREPNGTITKLPQRTLEATKYGPAHREAKEYELELLEQYRAPSSDKTWAEFRSVYESDYLPHTSRSNRRNWLTMAHRTEEVAIAKRQRLTFLTDVTPELLAHVRTRLISEVASASVDSYMATLRAGLSWAAELGWMPPLAKERRRGRGEKIDRVMRGRPLSTEEVERMITACKDEFPGHSEGWADLIAGIHLSGLRIGDAMRLHWTRHDTHHPVSLDGRRPKILYTTAQKNRTDQLVAIAPEFAKWLRSRKDKDGWVFNPMTRAGRAHSATHISRRISDVGKRAKVITVPAVEEDGEATFATAHDLRRTFGHRWAAKVMPPILQHLMRHRSIETTLRYYVGSSADQASRAVWDAWTTGVAQIDGAMLSSENSDQIGDQLE